MVQKILLVYKALFFIILLLIIKNGNLPFFILSLFIFSQLLSFFHILKG